MGDGPEINPRDRYNEELVANVHPGGWVNPRPADIYNLVVVGAGTAGLVAAAGAAGLGARVALIEKELMGGDCLNMGCVPSKTIISSARLFEDVAQAAGHGIDLLCGAKPDFPRVMERMRKLRARISANDSARRFAGMGVDVFLGEGVFAGPDKVKVAGSTLRFKKAVIATGARAFHLPLPGLKEAGYLTNETVFNLTELPPRLGVLGGGPIGCEMAQAFRRLGGDVTVLHNQSRLMNREDEDASKILHDVFEREGIRLVLGDWKLERVDVTADGKAMRLTRGKETMSVTVDEILVGVGRTPNVTGLGLESAGVEYDERQGVRVDDGLRTTNPNVFAAGDVCLALKFTHTADAAARIVIQNALFAGNRKTTGLVIPWCTYTDPEIAHVGLYPEEATARGMEVDTFMKPFSEVDRAVLEGEEEGFVKVHVKKGTDEILGATIVARHAGELIGQLTLAIKEGIGLKKLSETIQPYPTRADAIRAVGDMYQRTRLTPSVKKWMSRWLDWKRR
jgi:pyruvate/2-oxoglutarate dehydrogenase complex dihydrolipoamide dehydrogenase (E3) component